MGSPGSLERSLEMNLKEIAKYIEPIKIDDKTIYKFKCPYCQKTIVSLSAGQLMSNAKAHLMYVHSRKLSIKEKWITLMIGGEEDKR